MKENTERVTLMLKDQKNQDRNTEDSIAKGNKNIERNIAQDNQ